MLIAGIIAFCVVLLVLAFLAPRLSTLLPEGRRQAAPGRRERGRDSAPARLGELAVEAVRSPRKAVSKSGAKGREGRAKAPGP